MAQFQQRHYKTIARALESVPANETKATIVSNLALIFGTDNPKFKPDQFRLACNGQTETTVTPE